jgi:peptidyl-prolyl cis-trans isomerase D
MVGPFNDAAFNGKKGDLLVVTTQFGVHVMEILDKGVPVKQVQVGVIERKVEPSQKTYDVLYQQAMQFAMGANTGEKFDTAVIKQGLNKHIADNIRETDKNISGLEQPRELVRWAYQASKGDVSKVFTFGDKYVVAKLTDIKEKGTLPMDEVMDQVRAGAIKDKKAEMLMDRFNKQAAGASNIDAVGQKLNLPVMAAQNVLFSNGYIEGVGNVQRVVGTIFASKQGQLSKPVKGENEVIVFTVEQFGEPGSQKDYTTYQKQIMDSHSSRSEYETFNALKDKADVVDNLGRFY